MKVTTEVDAYAVGCPCCDGPMCLGDKDGNEIYQMFSNPQEAQKMAVQYQDNDGKPLTRIVKAKITFYES